VQQFQHGDSEVFLISLKAGGVGLNLTAADTVIHYDPWWNPASENQATDRAYRIGQDKPVFVFKLITRGTVEEKIQQLQQEKAALAAGCWMAARPGSGGWGMRRSRRCLRRCRKARPLRPAAFFASPLPPGHSAAACPRRGRRGQSTSCASFNAPSASSQRGCWR
jgi:hypothetical protein